MLRKGLRDAGAQEITIKQRLSIGAGQRAAARHRGSGSPLRTCPPDRTRHATCRCVTLFICARSPMSRRRPRAIHAPPVSRSCTPADLLRCSRAPLPPSPLRQGCTRRGRDGGKRNESGAFFYGEVRYMKGVRQYRHGSGRAAGRAQGRYMEVAPARNQDDIECCGQSL